MIITYNGKTPDVSRAAYIAENATITGDVVLEEGASVWFGAVIRGDSGPIRIGKNSNIQDNCVLHCEIGGKIEIGENVTVGHGAILHGCKVEDGCMIGMGSIILNDAVIPERSLVGAGALVTQRKTFPPKTLIMGSPAQVVRSFTEEEANRLIYGAKEYEEFSEGYGRVQFGR